ncbi:hypothetical protein CGZ80_01765 [Rhodopirellula sp. MGV]|nr:hypothetical protein CGZ80_01765 [Rhodopirellula sp. MGV]PNY33514.1 hypothetical protein C2E31_28265 [Rhodopirellula baltica]
MEREILLTCQYIGISRDVNQFGSVERAKFHEMSLNRTPILSAATVSSGDESNFAFFVAVICLE